MGEIMSASGKELEIFLVVGEGGEIIPANGKEVEIFLGVGGWTWVIV